MDARIVRLSGARELRIFSNGNGKDAVGRFGGGPLVANRRRLDFSGSCEK
jgi:hypothetical protein